MIIYHLDWKKLSEDESLRKDKEVVTELAQAFTAVQGTSPVGNQNSRNPWDDDEEEPIDIERNIEVTLVDIYAYDNFVKKPLLGVFSKLVSFILCQYIYTYVKYMVKNSFC